MVYTKDNPGTGRPKSARKRKPVLVRCPEEFIPRIDEAAKRLGLSRAALMLCATAEKLERMG